MGGGARLLKGGRVWVSGTSSDVNVGPVCLSGPPPSRGEVSPTSRGRGHGLPAPSEPEAGVLRSGLFLETRAQRGEGHMG